ncbi:MAG: heparinase II/III family protein [Opitutaceae bacterium]|jgi:hypothetical protein|nr:heparinase II/III family protein [Opitutaceae bacterium]
MIARLRISALCALCTLLACARLAASEPVPFPNAGFEDGLQSWVQDENDRTHGLSRITPDAARTGAAGLRVTQRGDTPGSWLQSARLPVSGDNAYRLEFWARVVEQSGIGVWIQFYDENRRTIKPPDGGVTVLLKPAPADWTRYESVLTTPAGAAWLTVAVHGYNRRAVLADFDNFSLTPVDASAAPAAKPAANALVPEPARVREIAALLPVEPRGLGPLLDDRAVWNALGADADFREKTLARAARFANEPTPEITRQAYDASVQSGDRKIDKVTDRRRFRLVTLVLAEGMENRGRFLPPIEKEINAICSEPSWILSGHVRFTFGRNDLGTAMTAWNLVTADTLLGGRLAPETRRLVRDLVRERVLSHYLAVLRGEKKPEWWAIDPNNWNSVVHGGVVASALAFLESREDRAAIVAAAETGTRFYIGGFPADGYSPEGMGYWKYGFGHYVLLAETVLAATGGEINFYDRDNIRLVAQFPRRFEIASGVYPAYGDAMFLESRSEWLFHIIDRRYGLDDGAPRVMTPDPMYSAFLYFYGINLAFDSSSPPLAARDAAVIRGHRLRDWFGQSQIYVGRPAADNRPVLAVSFKGGNNGVSHSHTDLGTFVAVSNGKSVLVDPGVTVYTARTFGPDRYVHAAINSLGHSVPLVAGQLQKPGPQHAAAIKEQAFTDAADTVTLDLARGYDVPALKELTRRFDYERAGRGVLTVTDRVSFTSPRAFGTALATYGQAREGSPGVWIVSHEGESLRVEITTSGGLSFTVTDRVLEDEARFGKVRRLGIDLDAPAAEAAITLKITPSE